MQVNITITGLAEAKQQLGAMAKQADYAAARALTTTAYAINAQLKTEMKAAFKGGATPYTLQAFKVKPASKTDLVAEVSLRNDSPGGTGSNYNKTLHHLFTGGGRYYKKLEGYLRGQRLLPMGLTVAPGPGMPLDSYGNMRRKELSEMLGVLQATIHNLRVYRKTGKGKAQKAVGYFVILPGDKSKKHPGIYKRIEAGTASTITPMVFYVNPVSYRKFIDLEKLGNEVVAKTFQPAFDAELAKAIANAK